jgi:hypothetical protein
MMVLQKLMGRLLLLWLLLLAFVFEQATTHAPLPRPPFGAKKRTAALFAATATKSTRENKYPNGTILERLRNRHVLVLQRHHSGIRNNKKNNNNGVVAVEPPPYKPTVIRNKNVNT